ncbi:hypothetical protein Mgra_00007087 [Meloidogyne graminicola]|uniref:Uncharacterized protein n=1 Tax=Meloidogyne graminicola TaxID=189291 RepID=A0A8S9ZJG3_9BILA|nr:hypothetical protein Mgra_00007087 [Meloidogyne graminicola]
MIKILINIKNGEKTLGQNFVNTRLFFSLFLPSIQHKKIQKNKINNNNRSLIKNGEENSSSRIPGNK